MINLLPPLEKEKLIQEQKHRLSLILGVSCFVFLIALSLVLFSVKIYISGKVQSEKVFIPPELQDFEKEILAINEDLQKLDSFYSEQEGFTGILEKISQILPGDIHLTFFSLNLSESKTVLQLSLQGFSPTRELLFQLKKNLESDQGFKNINFPPSNWVKPENIEFNASFKVEL